MIKTILTCTATIALCALVGCGGSDTDTAAAGRDKGPRPAPTTPQDAPGVGLGDTSRQDDPNTGGRPGAAGGTGGTSDTSGSGG